MNTVEDTWLEGLGARLSALEAEQTRLRATLMAMGPAAVRPDAGARLNGVGGFTAGAVAVDPPASDSEHDRGSPGPDHARQLTNAEHGLQIGSAAGGIYIASGRGPSLYAEAREADALIASSLSGHGVHAVGGGVRGGLGTAPYPCGVFAEGGSGEGLYATGEQTAVRGVSQAGYGASFAGGTAPLHLAPAATLGPPTTGSYLPGTLFVDAQTTLWLCMVGGSPGEWKRIVVQ